MLRQRIEAVAGTRAELFQRSRSCVEGRNGQLSLYHHGCHRLSDRKLAALTAIHNYTCNAPTTPPPLSVSLGKPTRRCSSRCWPASPGYHRHGADDHMLPRQLI